MRVFIIINCFIYVSYARPEFGYNYQRPDTGQIADGPGFGINSGGGVFADGPGFGLQTGGIGFGGHKGGTVFADGPGFGLQTGGVGFTGQTGGTVFADGPGFGQQTGGIGFTGHTGAVGHTSVPTFIGQPGGVVGGVHRHVYVYTAPQEKEVVHQKVIGTGTAQKHYKIIFIKAPSYSTHYQQTLAAQAQNQEKTIIYVLAKKPDEPGDITIPTVAPTPPSKPEVYFIRYKAQKDRVQPAVGTIDTGFDTTGTTGFVTTGITGGHAKYGPPQKIGY